MTSSMSSGCQPKRWPSSCASSDEGRSRWIQVSPSLLSSASCGCCRTSTACGCCPTRRVRMRGRLGIGTEGVHGRQHGHVRILARRTCCPRRQPAVFGQSCLECERCTGADEIDGGGERPEQERLVRQHEAAGGRPDDPPDLPREAPERGVTPQQPRGGGGGPPA